MREEFQTIEWAEPPIGDLVGEAVAKGRRMRTARRLRIGGAAVAVLVVAGLGAIPIVRGTGSPAPATVVVAAPSVSTSNPAPAAVTEAKRVKGTPAGLKNLPEGETSQYAGNVEYGDVSVQTLPATATSTPSCGSITPTTPCCSSTCPTALRSTARRWGRP